MSSVNIGLAFIGGLPLSRPAAFPYIHLICPILLEYPSLILKTAMPGAIRRRRTMTHTLFFILGFSLVYYTLGYSTNRFAELFSDYQDLIRRLSAILIMLMGLFLIGLFSRPC